MHTDTDDMDVMVSMDNVATTRSMVAIMDITHTDMEAMVVTDIIHTVMVHMPIAIMAILMMIQ